MLRLAFRFAAIAPLASVVLGACVATRKLDAQAAPTALDRRIDSVFAAFNRTSTPGCAIGVDRAGMPLIRRAYGMADLETGTPFTPNTISESGSTAKQFVAAAIVMLDLDGVLALDDDVTRWVPEAKGFNRRITIRHLLSHTSGIPDRYLLHAVEDRPAGETDHPNAEVIDVVSRLRDLNFDPGEDYLYSNTGYVVAVTVLERASGKSLQAFTQERIFGPLGMTRTRWREDHRVVVPGRAPAYSGSAATGFRNDHPFTRVFGSGGLLLTIDDFLAWSAAMQRGDGPWGAVRDSLEAVIRLNEGTAITYGLGVSSDRWRGLRRVSHTGSTGGYRAALFRFPEQATSVALLCNVGSANPAALATSVATIVLGDALAPVTVDAAPAIAVTPQTLAAVAGRYHSPRTEEVVILEVRSGQLVDSVSGATYLPRGGGRFRARNGVTELSLLFKGASASIGAGHLEGMEGPMSEAPKPTGLRFESPNARAVEYERVEAPTTAREALAALAGVYRSPELGAELKLIVRDGTLLQDEGWRGTAPLRPLYRDGFRTSGGEIVRFTRDRRGRVTGFVIWAGRVRHLRFDRLPAAR